MQRRRSAPSRNRATVNRLLIALPEEDYVRLLPHMTVVPLRVRQVLHHRESPIRHVYFPNDGMCSFTTVMRNGSMVEVATVGREGMVGLGAFLGGNRALSETFVQSARPTSTPVRLPVNVFSRELARQGALDEIVGRYSQAFVSSLMHASRATRCIPSTSAVLAGC